MTHETKQLFAGCATVGAAVLVASILMALLVGCGQITTGGQYEKTSPDGSTLRVTGPVTRNHNGAQTMEAVSIKPDGSVEGVDKWLR